MAAAHAPPRTSMHARGIYLTLSNGGSSGRGRVQVRGMYLPWAFQCASDATSSAVCLYVDIANGQPAAQAVSLCQHSCGSLCMIVPFIACPCRRVRAAPRPFSAAVNLGTWLAVDLPMRTRELDTRPRLPLYNFVHACGGYTNIYLLSSTTSTLDAERAIVDIASMHVFMTSREDSKTIR